MKKIISFILVLLVLSISLLSCGEEETAPDGMKLASNSTHYSLFVPESWMVVETTKTDAYAQVSSSDRTNVSAMFWSASEGYSTYEEFLEEYKAQLDEIYEDVSFIIEGGASQYGESARDYCYTAKLGKNYFKFYVTTVLEGNVFYVLTFTYAQDSFGTEHSSSSEATFTSYDTHKESMNQIIANFKVK